MHTQIKGKKKETPTALVTSTEPEKASAVGDTNSGSVDADTNFPVLGSSDAIAQVAASTDAVSNSAPSDDVINCSIKRLFLMQNLSLLKTFCLKHSLTIMI